MQYWEMWMQFKLAAMRATPLGSWGEEDLKAHDAMTSKLADLASVELARKVNA